MASKQGDREEKANQVDLSFGIEFLVLNHDVAQEFGMEAIHRRLAVVAVHHAPLIQE